MTSVSKQGLYNHRNITLNSLKFKAPKELRLTAPAPAGGPCGGRHRLGEERRRMAVGIGQRDNRICSNARI